MLTQQIYRIIRQR